jgi:Tol biopolymer transport system component
MFGLQDDQPNVMFSPMWHPTEDTLLVCRGPSFSAKSELHILAFPRASTQSESHPESIVLTVGKCNNAFPSFNEDGTKLVFRSTRGEYARREGDDTMFKNLYVLENTAQGEHTSPAKQLTSGSHVDTHCSWAPRGDLIVFSSTRDKPSQGVPKSDNGLDPGYFAVYLVNAKDKTLVRVVKSGVDLAGHVNHPVFSPDRRSIAFTSDLAAVSADPISLPLFLHSVRPYGDIFAVDIDPEDIRKNKDVEKFHRLTHSRYEYSMPAWTYAELGHLKKMMIPADDAGALQTCPYDPKPEGKDWVNFTGHLCLQNRCC